MHYIIHTEIENIQKTSPHTTDKLHTSCISEKPISMMHRICASCTSAFYDASKPLKKLCAKLRKKNFGKKNPTKLHTYIRIQEIHTIFYTLKNNTDCYSRHVIYNP